MQISDSVYNVNNSNPILNTGNTQATEQTNSANISGNAQITTALEGQLFNGKILDVNGGQVSILLDNNSTLYAMLGESVNINIGDNILFQIKENNGQSVIIKPYNESVNQGKNDTILKILEGNNLSLSDKNFQIAEGLMNNSMPVDKNTMQRLIQQSYRFSDTSVETLISMNKMQIPVNENTIGQYQDYLSNNHQLINNISDLSDKIVSFSDSIINEMTQEASGTSAVEILDFNSLLLESLSDSFDLKVIDFSASDNIPDQDISVKLSENIIENAAERLGIVKDDLEEVVRFLSDAGFKEDIISKLINDSETPMMLLNNINKILNNKQDSNLDANLNVKELFNLDGYKNILSQAVKNKFTLKPDSMSDPGKIDEVYKSLYEKTERLMQNFSSKGGTAGETLSEAAKNVQDRLDFMQNLNNMYAYAQIPLKMSSKEMNSELLVYLNKKRIQNKKDDVSALLHLDMEYLGPTDVHVSLKGGMVHTKFYVEDEQSAKILDEHMTMLERAVNEKGYSLTNEVITRNPTLDTDANMVVKDMFKTDMEKSVKRYSFDVRM